MDPTTGARGGGFYQHYSAEDLQRLQTNQHHQQAMLENMVANGNNGQPAMGGPPLMDPMTQHDTKPHMGGNSYHQSLNSLNTGHDENMNRPSMLDFGMSNGSSDFAGFQFDDSSILHSPTSLSNGGGIAKRRFESRKASQHQQDPTSHPSLDQQYHNMSPTFDTMAQSPMFQPGMTSDPMDMDSSNGFMPGMPMDMEFLNGLNAQRPNDMSAMNMYNQPSYTMPMSASMPQQPTAPLVGSSQELVHPMGNGREQSVLEKMPQIDMRDTMMEHSFVPSMVPPNPSAQDSSQNGLPQPAATQGIGSAGSVVQKVETSAPPSNAQQQQTKNYPPPTTKPMTEGAFTTGASMPNTVEQPNVPQYLNAYSQSGFDMFGVLMRVAARPKPQINIGAVDMSCAFVVCDAETHDCPIVYCSEMFERLTGYTRHEILGRNCRFLQAPDGKVQTGVKRKYVDDQAVWHLKQKLVHHQEAQISLINYRKGGQPFMNLLTTIPVSWDSDSIKYYVGFQVDLVEQPTSITNKNPGRLRLADASGSDVAKCL